MSCDHDHHHHNDDCNRTHPADRAPQADDPMEISGIEIEGDPQVMLACIVEEFARMGCDVDAIMRMFDDPFFQGPYGLTRAFGRDYIRGRVAEIVRGCGVMTVRIVEQQQDENETEQPVNLTVGGRAVARRS
jgi:hypothetical protein